MAELSDLERLAPAVDVDAATTQFRRSLGSGRRRRLASRVLAVVVVLAGIGAAALAFASRTSVEVSSGDDAFVSIASRGFDQREITVRLPRSLTATDPVVDSLTSSITAAGNGLRLEARRTDEEPQWTCDLRRQPLATRKLDGWLIELSGELSDATASTVDGPFGTPCDLLQYELDRVVIERQVPVYVGTSPIGPADGPSWAAALGGGDRLSVFERTCSEPLDGRPAGLVRTSRFDPARGNHITVFCDQDLGIEVWLDSAAAPDPDALARVSVARADVPVVRRIELFTHCGVRSTTVEGVLWIADPPVPDVGRPPGWGFNFTPGTFTVLDADRARFDADSGVSANFRRATPGTRDPATSCD
jgi:hypothetical protein